jgi:plastocyanin
MKLASRPLLAPAAAALLALSAAACGGGGPAATPTPSPSPSPEARGIEVVATEFAFDPSEITIPSGADTTITLVNRGIVEHDFTVDDLDVQILAPIGQTVSGTISQPPPGTYEVYCSIPGHVQNGMVGTLFVED